MYELADVRKLRKWAGMTQQQLAKRAGVSQSLLAKIETGKISPGYEKVRRIFAALDEMAKRNEVKVGELATRKVISASPSESVSEVIQRMKAHGISQVPVMEKGKVIGLVTEGGLLERVGRGLTPSEATARNVMEEAPPLISEDAGVEAAVGLLRHFPIVLIMKGGEVSGVVTKSDILGRTQK